MPDVPRLGLSVPRWAHRLPAALLLVAAALALPCASALALSQRGHVFQSSFGAPGAGTGELSDPAGVAVNEATGDVYVVDRANNRVERFGAKGEFIAVWGWGVKDGKDEFEVCESGCQAGIAGVGKGQLSAPEGVAVDNSTSTGDPSQGDVYVVADARSEHSHLAKFTAAGLPLTPLKQEGDEARWEGALDGVAVDGSGRLWVYRGIEAEGIVERFSDAEKNAYEEPSLEAGVLCPKPGFAVDRTGVTVYVDHEREDREGFCPAEEGETPRPVVAAKLGVEPELLSTLLPALDPLQTAAVATEPSSGDVYLANGETIAALTASGSVIQSLSLPGSGALVGGIAFDGDGDLYLTDSTEGKVDVFEPAPAAKPQVSGLSAHDLTPTSSELSAHVDPGGSDTHYFFEYGTADCASDPAGCAKQPAPPGADIGSSFGDQDVSVELQGLAPGTTYHYRLIAVNEHGQAEGAETFGTITTLPSAEGLLPDARAWEMVSPPEKDGSGIEPLRNEGSPIQASQDGNSIAYVANGPIVPEPEGVRAPYPTQAIATRSSSGWSSRQIVTPRTKGEGFIPGEAPEYRLFSEDLGLGVVQPDNQAAVEPLEQPPLAPEASEKTIYLRDNATGQYLPLVTAADDTAGTKFGRKLEFIDATPDLSDVVFSSEVSLTPEAGPGLYQWRAGQPLELVSVLPDGQAALEPALGAESHNVRGAISANGQRTFWTGESEVQNGEETETVRHLYMRDTATGRTLQLDAAVAPIAEPGEEESEVGFQAANSEGTKVFFSDTARLTEDSKLEPAPGAPANPADLYECEIVEEGGLPTCRLSDLTADRNAGETAEVLDLVSGISEDGSYLYFVANGALAPGASDGDCTRTNTETPPPDASCNLYMWHEGTLSFVATLSDEDGPDWGRSEASVEGPSPIEPSPDLSDLTVRASPNGQYLAFMSDRPLTGYDNVDANPAAGGARDEEVYLFDARSKLIVCASCDPTGAPPRGVFDAQAADEGLGLLVDRRQDWAYNPKTAAPTDHWLAGSVPGWTPLGVSSAAQALRQPRYLSDSARLFFDSADALVAQQMGREREETVAGQPASVGVENVYEYEPGGLGSCQQQRGCIALISSGTAAQESVFVDASLDGDDAFFVTAQPLVAADQDTNFDLYDARVCTEASPCLASQPHSSNSCESSDSCRPASPPASPPGPSGTATFSAPAVTIARPPTPEPSAVKPAAKPLTRAQKLAKALKTCRTRWKHSRGRRVLCEKRARKSLSGKRAGSHHRKGAANAGKKRR